MKKVVILILITIIIAGFSGCKIECGEGRFEGYVTGPKIDESGFALRDNYGDYLYVKLSGVRVAFQHEGEISSIFTDSKGYFELDAHVGNYSFTITPLIDSSYLPSSSRIVYFEGKEIDDGGRASMGFFAKEDVCPTIVKELGTISLGVKPEFE